MSNSQSGIAIVNKPSGPTSHDIVAQARRLYRTRAIGHAGTLDPMASGVLLLLVGEGTKLSSALTLDRKSYRATIRFGMATDSDDALGKPISEQPIPSGWLTQDNLLPALTAELQRTEQLPPAVSAIKQGGVPAYRRQRRGEVVILPPRAVEVFALDLLNASDESIELSISVSKGYYVRSLARDLGARLSMPAHLSALCRTSSGCFQLTEAAAWPCSSPPPLLPLGQIARRCLPTRVLTAEGERRARLGQALSSEHFAATELPPLTAPSALPPVASGVETGAFDANDSIPLSASPSAWLNEVGDLVALGLSGQDGTARVVRGFHDETPA